VEYSVEGGTLSRRKSASNCIGGGPLGRLWRSERQAEECCCYCRERTVCTWAPLLGNGSDLLEGLAVVTGFEIGAWRCAAHGIAKGFTGPPRAKVRARRLCGWRTQIEPKLAGLREPWVGGGFGEVAVGEQGCVDCSRTGCHFWLQVGDCNFAPRQAVSDDGAVRVKLWRWRWLLAADHGNEIEIGMS